MANITITISIDAASGMSLTQAEQLAEVFIERVEQTAGEGYVVVEVTEEPNGETDG